VGGGNGPVRIHLGCRVIQLDRASPPIFTYEKRVLCESEGCSTEARETVRRGIICQGSSKRKKKKNALGGEKKTRAFALPVFLEKWETHGEKKRPTKGADPKKGKG